MSWIIKTLSSSIGQKLIMALTGLFLCLFLVIHLIGNLQLLNNDYGYSFNKYAKTMTTSPLIKVASIITYAAILFHAFKGIALAVSNYRARSSRYKKTAGNANSSWFSRSMALLGTIILVFIVIHLAQFWYVYKFGETPYQEYVQLTIGTESNIYPKEEFKKLVEARFFDEKVYDENGQVNKTIDQSEVTYKDLSKIVSTTFKEIWYVLLYVFSMFAISFHLIHGFESAFQTLGLSHKKYNALIKNIGLAFSIIIPAAFASIPVIMYFN